jgi:hypothetical protein
MDATRMRCRNHPTDEALGVCRRCGSGLCAKCASEVQGVLTCKTCRSETASIVQLEQTLGGLKQVPGRVLSAVLVYGGSCMILFSLWGVPDWSGTRVWMLCGGSLLLGCAFVLFRRRRSTRRPTQSLP